MQCANSPAPNHVGEKYLTVVKKRPNIMEHDIDISLCLTEEIQHINEVNPVNLADKDWTDPYKLNKLLAN